MRRIALLVLALGLLLAACGSGADTTEVAVDGVDGDDSSQNDPQPSAADTEAETSEASVQASDADDDANDPSEAETSEASVENDPGVDQDEGSGAQDDEPVGAAEALEEISEDTEEFAEVDNGELLDLADNDGEGSDAAHASFVYSPAIGATNGCDAVFYAFAADGLTANLTREIVVNSCLEPIEHLEITDPNGAVVFDAPQGGSIELPWDTPQGVYTAVITTARRTIDRRFVVRPLRPALMRAVVDGQLQLAILGMSGRTVELDVVDLDNPDRIVGTLRFNVGSDLVTRPVSSDKARCVIFDATPTCFPDRNGGGAVCEVSTREATVGQAIAVRASELGAGTFGETNSQVVFYDEPGAYRPTVTVVTSDGRPTEAQCPRIVVSPSPCSTGEVEVFDLDGDSDCEPQVLVSCSAQSATADSGATVAVQVNVSPPGAGVVITLRDGDGSPAQTATVSGGATLSVNYSIPGTFIPQLDWATEHQRQWAIGCGQVRATGYEPGFTQCGPDDTPSVQTLTASAERSPIFRPFPSAAAEQSSRSTSEFSIVDCIRDRDGAVWWHVDFGWDQQWAQRSDIEQLRPADFEFGFECTISPVRALAGSPRTLRVVSNDGLSGLTGALDLGDGTAAHLNPSSGPGGDQIFYLDPGTFEPVFRLWHPMERDISCGEVVVDPLPDTLPRCSAAASPSPSILYQVSPDVDDTLSERSGPGTQFAKIGELAPGTVDGFNDCRRQDANSNSIWWRRVGGGWMAAAFLVPAADEAPGTETATPVPVKVDASTIYRDGTVLCVEGIAPGDTLNVRRSSSTSADIVGQLQPNSCGVRTLGGREGSWLRIASFVASDDLVVVDGWASGNFLVPASQIDTPEAVTMAEGFVPTVGVGAGNPAQTSPCVELDGGLVRCSVSEWRWEPAGDPCNGTGRDQWDLTGSGEVFLERSNDRWTITDRRLLAVNC